MNRKLVRENQNPDDVESCRSTTMMQRNDALQAPCEEECFAFPPRRISSSSNSCDYEPLLLSDVSEDTHAVTSKTKRDASRPISNQLQVQLQPQEQCSTDFKAFVAHTKGTPDSTTSNFGNLFDPLSTSKVREPILSTTSLTNATMDSSLLPIWWETDVGTKTNNILDVSIDIRTSSSDSSLPATKCPEQHAKHQQLQYSQKQQFQQRSQQQKDSSGMVSAIPDTTEDWLMSAPLFPASDGLLSSKESFYFDSIYSIDIGESARGILL
jgi:hypothetical protein